jgi:hypothetical protein
VRGPAEATPGRPAWRTSPASPVRPARPVRRCALAAAPVQAGFKDVISAWEIRPLHFLILIALSQAEGTSQQELCRITFTAMTEAA